MDDLNLKNEKPEDYLFYRKLELSENNFNLIQILHNKSELQKEVFGSCISNGVKIFLEKKEYLEINNINKENNNNNENEQNLQSDPMPRKPSKFLSLLENFVHQILICFNRPKPKSKNNFLTENIQDLSIRISTKETIEVLKVRISEILDMNINEFIMKKYGPNGTEIRDMNSKVSNISNNDINLYLELGTPLKEDEILLNVNYCDLDFSEFKIYPYKFHALDKFVIKVNDRVKDVKRRLIVYLRDKLNLEDIEERNMILRECKQDKPSKVIF